MTLGEYLRNEREKRGITIEQVASATKIGVKILHALESDQYSELPAKPFVKGFVRSYARFIGLDPQSILIEYNSFVEEKSKERPDRDEGHKGYVFEKKENEKSKTYLWAIMVSFIVLGGGVIFFLKPALKHKRVTHVESLRAQSKPAAEPTVTPSPTLTTTAQQPKTEPAITPISTTPITAPTPTPLPTIATTEGEDPDPLKKGDDIDPSQIKEKLVLKMLTTVTIRYKVDDKPTQRIYLEKEKWLVLKARSSILVQVSNPESLQFRYRSSTFEALTSWNRLQTSNGIGMLVIPQQVPENIVKTFISEATLTPTEGP